jgi:hypothetical protein
MKRNETLISTFRGILFVTEILFHKLRLRAGVSWLLPMLLLLMLPVAGQAQFTYAPIMARLLSPDTPVPTGT